MEKKLDLISGGISGAITDIYSEEALHHADLYYEEIRHMTTDVEKIARNTEFTESQILLVKDYLFVSKHEIFGGFRRFDPCFEIAESWRRLAFDKENIKPHDITLINHELTEMTLVAKGVSQEEAHRQASLKYNYSLEKNEYYAKLGIEQSSKNMERTSGGITVHNLHDDKNYDFSRW